MILDRDKSFAEKFRSILRAAGVRAVRTSVCAPNCNAFAERFILPIKSECLRKLVFFGEGPLRRAISEFVEHYHVERPHQGLGNEVIEPSAAGTGEVECNERLGGILKRHRRAA